MRAMPILDVAIGLSFVYLILSLAVTAANEMLAAWFKRRAWMLRKGLDNLLESDDLTAQVLDHPLVRSLYESRRQWMKGIAPLRALFGNGPSYIPSRTFALALLDTVAPVTNGTRAFKPEFEHTHTGRVLRLLLHEAGGNEEDLKRLVEVWFNDSMERVSGWYKRHTQAVSLACAVVVTVATNADTIVIARALWSDPALRQVVVERAEGYVRDQQQQASQPKGPDDAAPPPPVPPDQQADIDFDRASAEYQAAVADLDALQLPIGWRDAAPATGSSDLRLVHRDRGDEWPGTLSWRFRQHPEPWRRWFAAIRQHDLGWLVTMLAISLGAPFWFDILNKIVSIRSAGKAPEEKPKPPKVVPQPRDPGEEP
jgi:hypothetical protein